MIVYKSVGKFTRLNNYLERLLDKINLSTLDKYGREGVEALSSATPIDSGETANSWYYAIEREPGKISLSFYNSNSNKGVPIALVLQYGHATRNGSWVEGVDYINPAIRPIFDKLAKDAWKEVTGL